MLAYNKNQTNDTLKELFVNYCSGGNVCFSQVQVLDNILKGYNQDDCQLI
jgi:hypothetical protein